MITLKEKVREILAGVCEDVIYGIPRDFAAGERLCWRESRNRRYAQADAREHLAEVEYSLDIYAGAPEAASDLFAAVDERMGAAGFRREAAAELFEKDTGLSHTSLRYRALADAQGNIYQ